MKLLSTWIALIFLLQLLPAQEKEKSQPWYETITINGFASVAYTYNFNNPSDMKNQYHVFDFNANSFKLDVMELAFKKDVSHSNDAGFRVDMTAGSSIPQALCGNDVDFHQLFLSYIAPFGNGLRFDFGKFITPMGYEVIEGYDGYNDQYSRSLLFGFAIPFTHTGIKASYKCCDAFSSMLMVVNGWDISIDDNKSKSVGGQISYTPENTLALNATYLIGPEKPLNNADNRQIFDVTGTYTINEQLSLGINGDYGSEEHSTRSGGTALWTGLAGYARYNLSSDLSFALRGEVFNDRDGFRTGSIQTLKELTLTTETHPVEHFILRGDIRLDVSNENVFQRSDNPTDSQFTIGINTIFLF